MHIILNACAELGVPLAPKIIPPTQVLTYLGIEIDSIKQIIRLPDEKLSEIRTLLNSRKFRRKCTKRELLSFIGKLSFVSK